MSSVIGFKKVFRGQIMRLVEFFSVNNSQEEKEESNVDADIQKNLVAFILDDDEIYKTHILPIVQKMRKGAKLRPTDFSEVVKKCCLEFYEKEEMKKDPNEIFPKKMRADVADVLFKITTENMLK